VKVILRCITCGRFFSRFSVYEERADGRHCPEHYTPPTDEELRAAALYEKHPYSV
jgi:DNA-directed RNA polymerase subunit N (RpoN/RPB10)